MPVAKWIETVTNAITDGKVAEVLRVEMNLLERQLSDASLRASNAEERASKAEARILVLEDENKKLHGELADFRKADRQKNDFHGLPELAVTLLQLIAGNKSAGSYAIRDHMGLQDAKFDHLIDKLRGVEFVRLLSFHPVDGSHYVATAAGRDFLAERDLL